jgi:hypothetical protein
MRGVALRLLASSLIVAGALCWTALAHAGGGSYVFDGGSAAEQQQVRDALQASSFDWSLVPGTVTIHIGSYTAQEAGPGQIFLDARLLDSGPFAWGVVQHEYAHQVDFAVLDDAARARIGAALGTSTWCYGDTQLLRHDQYGCERFASTLAWAYWQSPDNCMRPATLGIESGAISPAAFQALLSSILGPLARPAAPARLLSAVSTRPRRARAAPDTG